MRERKAAYRIGLQVDPPGTSRSGNRLWYEVERHWTLRGEARRDTCEHRHRSEETALKCLRRWQQIDRQEGFLVVDEIRERRPFGRADDGVEHS
jgi:hypothetical protein